MRVVCLVAVILVAVSGCRLGSRTPAREKVRSYDLAPQSGYLAEGPTVSPDYAAPASDQDYAGYDEAAYRAAIQRDLVRINGLMADNDQLRQDLAASQATLNEARDAIQELQKKITTLEARVERAESRAERRVER